MDFRKSPIAEIGQVRDKAMGLFLQLLKTIPKGQGFTAKKPSEKLAVDVGRSHLLILGVTAKPGKPEISTFRLLPRPPTPEAVSERLQEVFREEKLQPEGIRIAVKGEGVVVRVLTFPQMKKEEFKSMIQYEAEKYIPFKLSEVVLDYHILDQNIPRGDMEVMEAAVVAVKQSEIYRALKMFQDVDLTVDLIDIAPFALANLIEFIAADVKDKTIGFIDLGAETTSFGILKKGKLAFIRDISFGGEDVANLIKRKLGLDQATLLSLQKDATRQTEEYRQLIQQALAGLIKELRLSVDYYSDHVEMASAIDRLYVSGGGARFLYSYEILEKEIRLPVQSFEVLSHFEIGPGVDGDLLRQNEDLLGIAGGLCVRT